MVTSEYSPAPHEATRNACRLCSPLGACLAYAGMAKTVPYLHGGQGCATYIRRYMISHFREPMDIASSSFGEATTVFGGRKNLFIGLSNVSRQYKPDMIGLASTCLSETIGEDVDAHIKEYRQEAGEDTPELVFASTPSYVGSHYDGFHRAVYAAVSSLAQGGLEHRGINLLPNMVSPADLRSLYQVCDEFKIKATILPDYSETLDGSSWEEYRRMPEGGTTVNAIREMGRAQASIEFSRFIEPEISSALYLNREFEVPAYRIGLPVGVSATDEFMNILGQYGECSTPSRILKERGRLLDSYVDAHKYVFGKKTLVYGDPDFTIGIGSFLAEIGMIPIMCIAGKERDLKEAVIPYMKKAREYEIFEKVDFEDIAEIADALNPDLLIGSSKGYQLARRIEKPVVRLGFPIHDRIGGARLRCLGYSGTQELFDRIVNALLEHRQEESVTGYSYM